MPRKTLSEIGNLVRSRDVPKDKFYTPQTLVDYHLSQFRGMIENKVIYEPFRGKGAYYNKFPEYFPNCTYEWSEIDDGRDFFEYNGKPDIIITNPPFSLYTKVLARFYELRPLMFSIIMGNYALTPFRIANANKNGYFLMSLSIITVREWFGNSFIATFSREINSNMPGFQFNPTHHTIKRETPDSENPHPSPLSQPLDVSSNTPTDNSPGHTCCGTDTSTPLP